MQREFFFNQSFNFFIEIIAIQYLQFSTIYRVVPYGAYRTTTIKKKKKHTKRLLFGKTTPVCLSRHHYNQKKFYLLLVGDQHQGSPLLEQKRKDKQLHEEKIKTFWRFFGRYQNQMLNIKIKLETRSGADGRGRGRCSSTGRGIRTSAPVSSPGAARLQPAGTRNQEPGTRNQSYTRVKKLNVNRVLDEIIKKIKILFINLLRFYQSLRKNVNTAMREIVLFRQIQEEW